MCAHSCQTLKDEKYDTRLQREADKVQAHARKYVLKGGAQRSPRSGEGKEAGRRLMINPGGVGRTAQARRWGVETNDPAD